MGCGYLFPVLGLSSYIFALIFNYGSTAGKWFGDKDVGEVSDEYNVSITPAGWTFAIWGIIYTWQALWLVYVLYLSLKRVNRSSQYFPRTFWVSYIAANLANGVWIAVWISEEIILAAVLLVGILAGLVVAGVSSHWWLVYLVPKMLRNGTEHELDAFPQSLVLSLQSESQGVCRPCCCGDEKQLLYSLVLNGVGIYATWTAIASCINISLIFRYVADWSNDASVAVGLTLLTIMILTYWFCDFVKFKNSLRFTFTPYFVLIWAFLGVLTKYSMNSYGSSVYICVLLACAVVASGYKVFSSVKLINKNNGTSSAGDAYQVESDD